MRIRQPELKPGTVVHVSGDAAELWIDEYDARVESNATVMERPAPHAKKVLLNIEYIDHQSNVCACVRRSRLLPSVKA